MFKIFWNEMLGKSGGNTYHFLLPASINEDQHIQFYYIFGELSPGISLKKKV
jgi:hypothetical protein